MTNAALVLSGGGAKGAFQVGAERYAREVKGYEWNVISGVSVGALNGTMLAMRRYDRLRELWDGISSEELYGGRRGLLGILSRIVLGRRSLYDNDRLRAILDAEYDASAFAVDFRVGAVSLLSGEFKLFRPSDPGFKQAVLASAAIPLFFPPVDVAPDLPAMIDGGVRNVSPIGAVLGADVDEIVVINCNPLHASRITAPPKNIFRIGQRVIEIGMNEIFVNDVGKFLRINRLVAQAAAEGLVLHKESGLPYRHYAATIIEPSDRLGDTMDFSRAHVQHCLDAGWETAKAALG